MKRFYTVTNLDKDSACALVVSDGQKIKAFALTEDYNEWVNWVNTSTISFEDSKTSLGSNFAASDSKPFNGFAFKSAEKFLSNENTDLIKQELEPERLELVDAIGGYGRRYAVKQRPSQKIRTKSDTSLKSSQTINGDSRSFIEYKASQFRADNTYSELAFNMKRIRAEWDANLGPSGGWRCPSGTQYGGYITDRFGRGCGGGIIRRVGRALVNAGRRIDNIADRRDRRRLNRAAERLEKPRAPRRERAAVGMERAARRVLGADEVSLDVANRRVRRNIDKPERNEPKLPLNGIKRTIDQEIENLRFLAEAADSNSRRQAIQKEIDDLEKLKRENPLGGRALAPVKPKPEFPFLAMTIDERLALIKEQLQGFGRLSPNDVRKLQAEQERLEKAKRRLGGDKPVPPIDQRESGQRRPGSRPVRTPVVEGRGQRGEVNRRVRPREDGERNFAPGWKPGEYRPGDKQRIEQRENRYAKVNDDALYDALELNAPRALRPGETADVEARRRQERLEVLQEIINRGLEVPDRYKREAKIYRLKKQRRQGAKPKVNERVAQALERAARRITGDRGRSRSERAAMRRKRRADRRERMARGLERGARRILVDESGRREERQPERAPTGRPSRRPSTERERIRSAVIEQSQREETRKPQPKRRDKNFDDVVLNEDSNRQRQLRQMLLEDFGKLADEWDKRLKAQNDRFGLNDVNMDYYIKIRDGIRSPAYIATLKAKANDWKVLKEYFEKDDIFGKLTAEERLEILEKLSPSRRKRIRENMKAAAPELRVRTPSAQAANIPEPDAINISDDVITPSVFALAQKFPTAVKRIGDNPKRLREVLNALDQRADDVLGLFKGQVERIRDRGQPWGVPNEISFPGNVDDFVLPFLPKFATSDEFNRFDDALQEQILKVQDRILLDKSKGGTAGLLAEQREADLDGLLKIARWASAENIRNRKDLERVENLFLSFDTRGDDITRSRAQSQLEALKRPAVARGADINDIDVRRNFGASPDDQAKFFNDKSAAELDDVEAAMNEVIEFTNGRIFELERKVSADLQALKGSDGRFRTFGEPGDRNRARQIINNRAKIDLYKERLDKYKDYRKRAQSVRAVKERQNAVDFLQQRIDSSSPASAPNANAPASVMPAQNLDVRTPSDQQRAVTPPSDFLPDGMMPRRPEQKLPNPELADLDLAIKHLYQDSGDLTDIPDEVIIQAIFHNIVDEDNPNGTRPDMDEFLKYGGPDRWRNDRFVGQKIKGGGNNEVWEVHKITDTQTGQQWFFKTSTYGDFDGINEAIGAHFANAIGFNLGPEDLRLGPEIVRLEGGINPKPGRWILMRNIADLDSGELLDASNDEWKDAAFFMNPDKMKNLEPRDAARLLVMDYVLHNLDRHAGNFMMKQDRNGKLRIAVIDNGLIGGGRAPNARDNLPLTDPSNFDAVDFIDFLIDEDIDFVEYADGDGLAGFNNPAAVIKGWRGRRLFQHRSAEQRQIFKNQVIATVEHLRDNIDRLLDQQTLEANGAKLSPNEVSYIEALKRLVEHRLEKLNDSSIDRLVGWFD